MDKAMFSVCKYKKIKKIKQEGTTRSNAMSKQLNYSIKVLNS